MAGMAIMINIYFVRKWCEDFTNVYEQNVKHELAKLSKCIEMSFLLKAATKSPRNDLQKHGKYQHVLTQNICMAFKPMTLSSQVARSRKLFCRHFWNENLETYANPPSSRRVLVNDSFRSLHSNHKASVWSVLWRSAIRDCFEWRVSSEVIHLCIYIYIKNMNQLVHFVACFDEIYVLMDWLCFKQTSSAEERHQVWLADNL